MPENNEINEKKKEFQMNLFSNSILSLGTFHRDSYEIIRYTIDSHIFQTWLFCAIFGQIKRYFIFGILSRPKTPKKICLLVFQVLPNISAKRIKNEVYRSSA